MPQKFPTAMGPQKNVISLQNAIRYTHNWRHFVHNLYGGTEQTMPHGIFIPFGDIYELGKLQKEIKYLEEQNGEKKRIYIVGVRCYYILKTEILIPIPGSGIDYPVEGILVAVYQTNHRHEGSIHEYDYDKNHKTYDLVVPVPSLQDVEPGDHGDYSIYDITRPCPTLCDLNSPLFSSPVDTH